MDKYFKKRWLKALRSGKYKQGMGSLKRDDRYCCLGVFAEDCGILVPVQAPYARFGAIALRYGKASSTTSLPTAVCEAIGLSAEAQGHLIEMNDYGHSFKQIADWIEEHL